MLAILNTIITILTLSGIIHEYEVVNHGEGCQESSLKFQGIFRGMCKNSKASLQHSKNTLDNIAQLSIPQVEQLLFILWPVPPLNFVEMIELSGKGLTEVLQVALQQDDSTHLDRVSRVIHIVGNLHWQGNISHLECRDL
jgi:hypothetical protein